MHINEVTGTELSHIILPGNYSTINGQYPASTKKHEAIAHKATIGSTKRSLVKVISVTLKRTLGSTKPGNYLTINGQYPASTKKHDTIA